MQQILFKCLGAAQTVTGSKYIVDLDRFRLMIDCGLFQGLKEWRLRNWELFPIDPHSIDAICITHAHIDHIGYLPRLCKQGFRGAIYCTEATADLIPMMLKDAAKLQEEEAAYAARKGYSKHSHPLPLYTLQDVTKVLPLIRPVPLRSHHRLGNGISLQYEDAGHVVGAASLTLTVKGVRQTKKIVFSGDLGNARDPLLNPPTPLYEADSLIVESTYGGRLMPEVDVLEALAQEIELAFAQEGCLLIPAFALGRTQTLLYYLKQLFTSRRLKPCPVYVDSPMAIEATHLYAKHLGLDQRAKHYDADSLFHFPSLHYCPEISDSKRLNEIRAGAIIISASGMANGGRIVHHLYNRLTRPQDTVLFVGYQAEGTRGRRLLDGEPEIKMFGEYVPVKCRIRELPYFSAHADHEGLMKWLSNFQHPPKMTFITHGEPQACQKLQQAIVEQLHWHNVIIPEYMESFALFNGF
ncbi:MAG: MBL fold metallo-hydrolase [Cytophagales bacterium]|nr:MBL fold metallo-hydrolase [Bernardetiaceae bacterium]MDW8205826.1 MBL fold metallo-hydrolase [Cytophagales bacterium]